MQRHKYFETDDIAWLVRARIPQCLAALPPRLLWLGRQGS
jgi:hypothetical protein